MMHFIFPKSLEILLVCLVAVVDSLQKNRKESGMSKMEFVFGS